MLLSVVSHCSPCSSDSSVILKMREYEDWVCSVIPSLSAVDGGGADAAMEGQLVMDPHADKTRTLSGRQPLRWMEDDERVSEVKSEELTSTGPQPGHGIDLVRQGVDMAGAEIQLADADVMSLHSDCIESWRLSILRCSSSICRPWREAVILGILVVRAAGMVVSRQKRMGCGTKGRPATSNKRIEEEG